MPAAFSVKRGLSSTAAAGSSSNVGVFEPHCTSRSGASEGSMSSLACATQRALNLDTVCCKSTPSIFAYCAPGTSVRFTHTVTGASGATWRRCQEQRPRVSACNAPLLHRQARLASRACIGLQRCLQEPTAREERCTKAAGRVRMAQAARCCGHTSAHCGALTDEPRLRRARLKGGRGSTAVGQGRSMVARLGVYEAAV